MFKPNTLLIVGAGASKEVNLPLGTELVEQISSLVEFKRHDFSGQLSQSTPLVRPLLNFAGSKKTGDYTRAASQMIAGMASAESVDRFIDRNRDNEFIRTLGKAAIIQAIAQAERNSMLSGDKGLPRRGASSIYDTWYWTFVKMLLEGSPPLERLFDDIAVVCFNYDRCIEHFLICELMRSYSLDRTQAAELVKRLRIWHPYGSIGPLPMHDPGGLPFGDDETSAARCFQLGERIKTFTEEHEDSDTIAEIRECVRAADTIVFLGFGYYGENLKLIRPDVRAKANWVLGTGFGLSASDRNIVVSRLQSWTQSGSAHFEVTNMKCAELLSHYRMALSA